MSDELTAYLRTEAGRKFAIGSADCVTFIADWARERLGSDPLGDYRGYSPEAAREVTATWGGLVRELGRGARRASVKMTRDPQQGDVAVVMVGPRVTCAIRTARGWAMRFEDEGLARLPCDCVRVIAAWKL